MKKKLLEKNYKIVGKNFIAYQGSSLDKKQIEDVLQKFCSKDYVIKTESVNNVIFSKIIHQTTNNTDPYWNNEDNVLTMSWYNESSFSLINDSLENDNVKYNLKNNELYKLINYLYKDNNINIFNILKKHAVFGLVKGSIVIYDKKNNAFIAGVGYSEENNEYCKMYYGFTREEHELIYSNNNKVLNHFCDEIFEMKQYTYIKNGTLYDFENQKIMNIKENNELNKKTNNEQDNNNLQSHSNAEQIKAHPIEKKIIDVLKLDGEDIEIDYLKARIEDLNLVYWFEKYKVEITGIKVNDTKFGKTKTIYFYGISYKGSITYNIDCKLGRIFNYNVNYDLENNCELMCEINFIKEYTFDINLTKYIDSFNRNWNIKSIHYNGCQYYFQEDKFWTSDGVHHTQKCICRTNFLSSHLHHLDIFIKIIKHPELINLFHLYFCLYNFEVIDNFESLFDEETYVSDYINMDSNWIETINISCEHFYKKKNEYKEKNRLEYESNFIYNCVKLYVKFCLEFKNYDYLSSERFLKGNKLLEELKKQYSNEEHDVKKRTKKLDQ